jgi:hypothetical protein
MRKMARFLRKKGMKENTKLIIPTKESMHELISKLNNEGFVSLLTLPLRG